MPEGNVLMLKELNTCSIDQCVDIVLFPTSAYVQQAKLYLYYERAQFNDFPLP